MTQIDINRETYYTLCRIDGLLKLHKEIKADKLKSHRIKVQECVWCFYQARIAGQAFTDYTCSNCYSKETHENTNAPFYCGKCAKDLGICRRCGADVNLKTRNDSGV